MSCHEVLCLVQRRRLRVAFGGGHRAEGAAFAAVARGRQLGVAPAAAPLEEAHGRLHPRGVASQVPAVFGGRKSHPAARARHTNELGGAR